MESDTFLKRILGYTTGAAVLIGLALFLRALFAAQSASDSARPGLQQPAATPIVSPQPFALNLFPEDGDQVQPAWSPDGRFLAYVTVRDGRPYVMKRDWQTAEVSLIAEDAWNPTWSPDGSHLLYMGDVQNTRELYVTSLGGTGAVKIDVPSIAGIAWAPDGQTFLVGVFEGQIHIFTADGGLRRAIAPLGLERFVLSSVMPDGVRALGLGYRQGDPNDAMLIIDLQTGEATRPLETEPVSLNGIWSPDGQSIAYIAADEESAGEMALRTVGIDGSERRTLSRPGQGQLSQAAWSPNSLFVAYLANIGPTTSELYVSRMDGSLSVSTLPGYVVNSFSWSPDGAAMAVSLVFEGQADIAIAPVDDATLQATAHVLEATPSPIPSSTAPTPVPTRTPPSGRDFYTLERLTNTPNGAYRPAVSPEGRRVAYASERDGNWDIYLLDLGSSLETRLTDDPLNDMAPSWSPDGMRIAYQHNVPTQDGPVRVEHIVMNGDGSNKTVVATGAAWNGNEPPAWSPSGARIAFTDSGSIVVVSTDQQREVARFRPDVFPANLDPVWIDDRFVAFSAGGTLVVGDVEAGSVGGIVNTATGFARMLMWSPIYNRIAYFALEDIGAARLMSISPDSAEPSTLAAIGASQIQHAAWSSDGRFIAYLADDSVGVAVAWTDQYRDRAPMFSMPNVTGGLSDLVGVSWMPDNSGFVIVAAVDGRPDLYRVRLNQPAIEAYLQIISPAVQTPTPAAPFQLTPTPGGVPLITISGVSFSPDPFAPVDRNVAFEFGADVSAVSSQDTIATIGAFQLYPSEDVPDCESRTIPTDRSFWANQNSYAPGQYTFSQRFRYSDLPGTDRLVVYVRVSEAGIAGQVLYCTEQVYGLTPTATSVTRTPTPTPFPPAPSPVPIGPH